jgi:hypothetical protein
VTRRRAAETPWQVVEKLLGVCDDSEVLVGGQALMFWVARYGLSVPKQLPVISQDADFLTNRPPQPIPSRSSRVPSTARLVLRVARRSRRSWGRSSSISRPRNSSTSTSSSR